MLERLTRRARRAVVHAQDEAVALGHNFLGTEHLLLGLIREPDGVAGRVLANASIRYDDVRREVITMIGSARGASGLRDAEALAAIGIDLDAVRDAVEGAFGEGALDQPRLRGRRRAKPPRFVPRAKKVMDLSLREAKTLGHDYIGTEHLLLAILRLQEGVAFEVLKILTPAVVELREHVMEELRQVRRGA